MNNKTKKRIRILSYVLFIIYVIFMIYGLFFSEYYGRVESHSYQYNLEPFQEIKRFFQHKDIMGIKGWLNFYGNIIVFIPFGAIAPFIDKRRFKFVPFLFTAVLLIVCIELTQLVTKVGIFDVDDIILNFMGTMIGYMLFRIVYRIYRRIYVDGHEKD